MKTIKKVKFGKRCDLCKSKPITGVIDFSKKGKHAALCNEHLLEFCKSVIDKNK